MTDDLREIMLNAIRFRARQPGGKVSMAQRDRAWLLGYVDRLEELRAAAELHFEGTSSLVEDALGPTERAMLAALRRIRGER